MAATTAVASVSLRNFMELTPFVVDEDENEKSGSGIAGRRPHLA
jgi:hypothetical protein